MENDIYSVKVWAKIFTEPEALLKKVSKNWLLHKRAIKKDIKQEKADWSAGNYFAAGKNTASVIDLLVPYT